MEKRKVQGPSCGRSGWGSCRNSWLSMTLALGHSLRHWLRYLVHCDILTPVYSAVTSECTADGRNPKRKEEVVFVFCYLCQSDSRSFWALLDLGPGKLCCIRVSLKFVMSPTSAECFI